MRQKGDWEAWLEFFLEGVIETSEQGVASARRLIGLFDRDKEKISPLKRAAASALRVHGELQKAPLLSVPVAAKKLGISQPTIQKSLDHLVQTWNRAGGDRQAAKPHLRVHQLSEDTG